MTELSAEIRAQVAAVNATITAAQAEGDDYLVDVSRTELDDLARLAAEHGITVPELATHRGAA